jgi:hypothetical protein
LEGKLLVGLRKPINRGSALCGLAGRVAATEAPHSLGLLDPPYALVGKLLVGLRKPINRGSALCGLAGRVAATEAPP